MKTLTLTSIFSAIAISVVASGAMAANPNGPKPKCPLGQLPVLEMGQYHCEDAKIQSQSSPSQASTSANRKSAPKRTLKPVKVKVVFPDYTILGAKRVQGTSNTFAVKVKNMGTGPSPANQVFGVHYLPDNTSWGADAIIPPLSAGQVKTINITIPPKNFNRGDRVLFTADNFKQVVESNENNNKYAINYK